MMTATNLDIVNCEVVRKERSPSDHFLIKAKLLLKASCEAKKFTEAEKFYTARDVKVTLGKEPIVTQLR